MLSNKKELTFHLGGYFCFNLQAHLHSKLHLMYAVVASKVIDYIHCNLNWVQHVSRFCLLLNTYSMDSYVVLTLCHLGGFHPWETFLNNSITPQDIKMKFFKFNLILMGAILHMVTILINLRCCYDNLFL